MRVRRHDQVRVAAKSLRAVTEIGFIRLKNAPGFARGFSRHKSGVQWYLPTIRERGHTEAAWRNGVGLCSRRNLMRDIQAPVRQWRVRPLIANAVRGRFSSLPLDTGPMPDKSSGEAAFWPASPAQVRFNRMNLILEPRWPPFCCSSPSAAAQCHRPRHGRQVGAGDHVPTRSRS